MSFRDTIFEKKNEIVKLAAVHGATNVRIFGSTARGEDNPNSDVDLLVEFDDDCSLFDLIRLREELTQLLGRQVDVVTAEALNSRIRQDVLGEALPL